MFRINNMNANQQLTKFSIRDTNQTNDQSISPHNYYAKYYNVPRVGIWRSYVNRSEGAMLHIGDPCGSTNFAGHRDWMNVGTYYCAGSDNMYIGLREIGVDTTNAVINWGNNPSNSASGDRLIFNFTAAYNNGIASGYDGIEVARMWSNGNQVRTRFGYDGNLTAFDPTNVVHIIGDNRGTVNTVGGNSGLQFQKLTSRTPKDTLWGNKGVLSVDTAGNVIYVEGATGILNNQFNTDGTLTITDGNNVDHTTTQAAWLSTGNAGTTAGPNFIGTTDAADLMFRVDGEQAGLINIDWQNTFLGYQSGNSNTFGNRNTYMGHSSGLNNTEGSFNCAFGFGALENDTLGGGNTAIGVFALNNNFGSNTNTAIGAGSLMNNTSGENNIALGAYAGRNNSSLSNLLFINSIERGTLIEDISRSIIFGIQNIDPAAQTLRLNSQVFVPYIHAQGSATDSVLVKTSGSGQIRLIPQTTGLTAANNGTSISNGTVVFGNDLNGNAATLTSHREIPMDNHNIVFTLPSTPVDTLNRIGIGTRHPLAEVEIFNNIGSHLANTLPMVRNGATYGAGWQFVSSGTGAKNWGIHSSGTGNYQGTGTFVFHCITDSTDAMILTSTGNHTTGGVGRVGIGGVVAPNNYIQVRDLINFDNYLNNTFLGYKTGTNCSTGHGNHNTANGYLSLYSNTEGSFNTAMGDSSLFNNTNAYYNVAIGSSALSHNVSGQENTAVGCNALNFNIAGYNTAFGSSSLESNINGFNNTAVGQGTLHSNIDGKFNTAIGISSMASNKSGNYNTAIGSESLVCNTSGYENTASGIGALNDNKSGNNNSSFGSWALSHDTTGSGNTSIGSQSLFDFTTGNNNTALGYFADVSISTPNLSGAMAIGYNAKTNLNNKIVIGTSANTNLTGGFGTWQNWSDGRFKNNIKEDVPGLDFILKLRPVTYTIDAQKIDEFLGIKQRMDTIKCEKSKSMYIERLKEVSSMIQTGFIAQEVEKIANEIGYNFDGVHKPENDNDNYTIGYSTFVVPLVKAVQEQQKMIDSLKTKVNTQQTTMDSLKKQMMNQQATNDILQTKADKQQAMIDSLVKQKLNERLSQLEAIVNQCCSLNQQKKMSMQDVELSNGSAIVLDQNVPNPFAESTTISYFIPDDITSADIIFTDNTGKVLKTVRITERGSGILKVYGQDLSSGVYSYTLVADGKTIDSKKMIKLK